MTRRKKIKRKQPEGPIKGYPNLKPVGRPKGVPNKVTSEAREFARELCSNPTYRKRFLCRMLADDLPPLLEQMCWHYAYGKPKDTLVVEPRAVLDPEKLRQLSDTDFGKVMEAVGILKAKAVMLSEPQGAIDVGYGYGYGD